MRAFILDEQARSRGALAAAKALLEIDPDSAANRAYYAAFHSVRAYFAARGQVFERHATIRNAFQKELVQTHVLDAAAGQDYDLLVELQEAEDYAFVRLSVEDARDAIETAERLIGRVTPLLALPAGQAEPVRAALTPLEV